MDVTGSSWNHKRTIIFKDVCDKCCLVPMIFNSVPFFFVAIIALMFFQPLNKKAMVDIKT